MSELAKGLLRFRRETIPVRERESRCGLPARGTEAGVALGSTGQFRTSAHFLTAQRIALAGPIHRAHDLRERYRRVRCGNYGAASIWYGASIAIISWQLRQNCPISEGDTSTSRDGIGGYYR